MTRFTPHYSNPLWLILLIAKLSTWHSSCSIIWIIISNFKILKDTYLGHPYGWSRSCTEGHWIWCSDTHELLSWLSQLPVEKRIRFTQTKKRTKMALYRIYRRYAATTKESAGNQAFSLSWSGVKGSCPHCLKSWLCGNVWMLDMWSVTEFSFSLRSCRLPTEEEKLHQSWFWILVNQGPKS